jgi:predicted transcriptional regulator
MVGTWGDPDIETTRPQLRQGPAPARSTLADWLAPEPAPSSGTQDRHDQIGQKRVRVSLRLDAGRHARLKLVATQRNCTLQSLFTEAIDEFFVRHAPDLHGIAEHLRRGIAAAASGEIISPSKRESEDRDGSLQSR